MVREGCAQITSGELDRSICLLLLQDAFQEGNQSLHVLNNSFEKQMNEQSKSEYVRRTNSDIERKPTGRICFIFGLSLDKLSFEPLL